MTSSGSSPRPWWEAHLSREPPPPVGATRPSARPLGHRVPHLGLEVGGRGFPRRASASARRHQRGDRGPGRSPALTSRTR